MTEREIFFEALEKAAPEARAAYLQVACGNDATLRHRLDDLLREHFGGDSLLAGPVLGEDRPVPAAPAVSTPAEEAPSRMLGRYKLLEKLGEGGFGEVWMAEQREPVKRRVALKIIKLGMDSRQIVARFEAERQALAMMDHPNIAKIFDAGRPYFVMELVRGVKITDYCDQGKLTTHERLDLFIKVCHAIQHAHQKGIIHRDIKPSNILVTLHDGVPVPKVIDFGIAKATQGELTEKTIHTQFQQFIGTPAYSDEPARRESGGPKELRRGRTAPGRGLQGSPTAPSRSAPASQRPAADQGIPRTTGATLRRLGQAHPGRRVETATGRVPASRQSNGEEGPKAMNSSHERGSTRTISS